jgi:hypothetical protein
MVDIVSSHDSISHPNYSILIHLCSFVVCLYLPSDHRDCSVKVAIGTYIAFLLVSVIPILNDVAFSRRGPGRRLEIDIFFAIHSQFLSWIITSFNVVAIYFQIRETRLRPKEQALTGLGLAVQAVIFTFVAFSWVGRVEFSYPDGRFSWRYLLTWYAEVGWATIDSGIFAIGQAIVACHRSHVHGIAHGESEPLLSA